MTKVLVFGSLNLDRVYKVQNIVQEGETVSAQGLNIYPGGKGLNQAVAFARAGAEVALAGGIGADGDLLRETLEDAGVKCDFLELRDSFSGHAVIQVDEQGRNCILIHPGANHGNTSRSIGRVLRHFVLGDLVVLQNEIDRNAEIMKQAKDRRLRIALNPSPMDEAIKGLPLDLVDCFMVNEHEAAALMGQELPADGGSEAFVTSILRAFGRRWPGATVVLTLGERGSACRTPTGELYRQEAIATKVVDTTGAGDTFTGYFLQGRLQGLSYPESLRLAATAAALAIAQVGAAPAIPKMTAVLKRQKVLDGADGI